MNDTPHSGPVADDRAELARLLPAPAAPGLGPDRHRTLKEHLMNEITAAQPARRSHRRLWWSLAPMATVGAAVAVALALGAGSAAPTGTVPVEPGSDRAVDTLMQQFALAAEEQPATDVRDDQYAYVKSLVSYSSIHEAASPVTVSLEPPSQREIWYAVDGTRAGRMVQRHRSEILEVNLTPSVNSPTYRFLQSLPTDPDALLARIYADTKGMGTSPQQEAFTTIGDLLRESVAPPKVTAALYRAAAKIPGVVVVADATDAAGRHGVAVARLDETTGARQEWIFDRDRHVFLGEREVQVAQSPDGIAKGTLLGTSAVLDRAIVDSPTQTG